jgi:hypothetical protein
MSIPPLPGSNVDAILKFRQRLVVLKGTQWRWHCANWRNYPQLIVSVEVAMRN